VVLLTLANIADIALLLMLKKRSPLTLSTVFGLLTTARGSSAGRCRLRLRAGFGHAGSASSPIRCGRAKTPSLKCALGGLRYARLNPRWEIVEFDHRPSDWSQARRCIVARKLIEETDPEPTLWDEEGFSSCLMRPCHRAVAIAPPERLAASVSLQRSVLPSPPNSEFGPWI
jgi:hypothetical protein